MNDPKTLEQFKLRCEVMTPQHYFAKYDTNADVENFDYYTENYGAISKIHSFDGMYILEHHAGNYTLYLDRDEFCTTDLQQLIERLYDWAKFQYYTEITTDEMEDDLHERARALISALGFECSLDEIDTDELTDENKLKVWYLLNQFDDVQSFKR